ncbi:hypothetical protein J2810_001726 [Chryseobacterium rhizosphaerae]|uniref:hypothetical protein n=1 Tax=Chryseobacterium rhizosphaerae TaxID=395937 RepID=UPI0006462710|nr:hypothetical protein [Chryseobacterium rhizosphaerae]MDR6545678.1 hypothetical protein [Chryseobacterium rhizosphaerae]
MAKKNLPLSVLKALEPFVGLQGKLFTIEHPGNSLLLVKDKDPNSKFYYSIERYQVRDEKVLYSIMFSPRNEKDVGAMSTTIGGDSLTTTFNSWVQSLENYSKVKSFFDDPILESYEEEFYTNFELVDEDAETRPFRTTQILQLDYLLEQVSTRLIEMTDDNNREEVESIITDITEVRESLPTRSQKWIAEHVSKIFAKIAKQGVSFIKEFWAEGKKEIIKNIVKGLVEAGTELIN